MQNENTSITREEEMFQQKIRNFDLVSAALKAEPVGNKFIKEFSSLIEDDFNKKLCNVERGSNDADNLRKLDYILREMRLIASCPKLHTKSVGAIGGGFSSGKSSLINSFLVDTKDIKLAVGMMPVTAIPSYVICGKDSQVNGLSFRDGLFPIALDMYREISHEFINSLDFDLKKIIKYATVLAPMDNNYFEHLCLIDTPGYNPPGSGNTEHDFETASKYIRDAEFLIWTVGLDADGTFPKSDIEFIDRLKDFGTKEGKRHLYIVANKAQLKPESDVKRILDQFEETLTKNRLSYAGISAYNSRKKEELFYREKSLFSFLTEHNKPSRIYAELKGMLYDVFRSYFMEANRDFDEKDKKRAEIQKLTLQAVGISDDDVSTDIRDGLKKLRDYFQSEEKRDERLKRIEELRDRFLNCLNNFCDEVGVEHKEEVYCMNCGKPTNGGRLCVPLCEKFCSCGKKLKATAKFCSDCGKEV